MSFEELMLWLDQIDLDRPYEYIKQDMEKFENNYLQLTYNQRILASERLFEKLSNYKN